MPAYWQALPDHTKVERQGLSHKAGRGPEMRGPLSASSEAADVMCHQLPSTPPLETHATVSLAYGHSETCPRCA